MCGGESDKKTYVPRNSLHVWGVETRNNKDGITVYSQFKKIHSYS